MNQKIIKKDNRGGRREGAGRPSGSKDKVSRETVREIILQSTGESYEQILIGDFLKARETNDTLAYKYHNLISSKLIPTLNELDINESEDGVEAKRVAFAEALAALTAVGK